MADRLLVDLDAAGPFVSVGTWPEGGLPEPGERCELAWPLDGEALEDLRWYLEDYLRGPFGVYEDRGPQVQEKLAGWGAAVFGAVFAAGAARDAYVRARAGRAGTELIFRSVSPGLLGLPWELMADPARPTPLALDLAGVSRSVPVAGLGETFAVPGGRLRVLMVISRPAGTSDVGYRMIARPLLDRLDAVRGQVDLVVLRPPTLDALRQTLLAAARAGEPFHVVHFDGHGVLAGRSAGAAVPGGRPVTFHGLAGEGMLAFEKPAGGKDLIAAAKVAQVLSEGAVPVVVLNACQSAAIGRDLEAAVATRLLQEGTASVVAMAYTVYAVAAAEFMAAFYERLFAGDPVSAAVTAGRRRMFQVDGRPSPKGVMPLADWLVPVHYLRKDVAFPQARTVRASGVSLDAALDEARNPGTLTGADAVAEDLDQVGELDRGGVFVGRDDLFWQLEAAARLQHVVVLHGPGGTGKTELARAFGRWWRDTGGVERPEWVVWHSFEPGAASFGLDGVITQIGLGLFGAEFALLDPAGRRQRVERELAGRRVLLIWDNFETVASMPDPAGVTPPLDDPEGEAMARFLARMARSRSAVIITSRSPEGWLSGVRRIQVAGLEPEEAAEYADTVLAPYPAAAGKRAGRAFGELMEWLDGHPLSIRLVLPYLDTTTPQALLAGLRGTASLPGQDSGGAQDLGGRGTSLAACIGYSYAHLGEHSRRLLPAVCLFEGVAVADVLAMFSQVPGVPDRFAPVGGEDWQAVLEDAARTGLLTGLGRGMYQIHPALPAYLAALWRHSQPAGYDADRKAATRALAAACAELSGRLVSQIESGNAELAYKDITAQQRTLGAMLGYSLDHELWAEAASIGGALEKYWAAQGVDQEAGDWADRVRLATEDAHGAPPPLDTPAGQLWLFFVGTQANRQRRQGRLDAAERAYLKILGMLQAQSASPQQQQHVAAACHQLGNIARDDWRLDEARQWYRKSLAINEDLGNRPGMADTYHQLGMVAKDEERPDEAEQWYRKALAIEQDLGNRPGMADTYHQLGMAAEARARLGAAEERLGEAEEWYRQSLAIEQDLGNRPGIAKTYHQLGMAAEARARLGAAEERLGEAEEWYRQSLAIKEDLGDRPGMAKTYHQLGRIAEQRGRLNEVEQRERRLGEAERWYRKSLAINQNLGNRRDMALNFGQLGLLAEARDQPRQALEWMIGCVALFDEFPHPATGPGPEHLARLTAQLGTGALEECWRKVTGGPLPRPVRDYVTTPRSTSD